MRIAAFYENIIEGARGTGISERDALTVLRDMGMSAVYISDHSLRPEKGRLLALFSELGLAVEGLHDHFDLGADPDNAGPFRMIELAREAGAGHVLIVPGVIPVEDAGSRQDRIENMKAALSEAVAYGNCRGIQVSIEDFDSLAAPYNTIEGLKWFLDQTPGLMCSFDTGNFVLYQQDEVEAFRLFRDRICTLHIKDRSKTAANRADRPKLCADGSLVYTAPVGAGYIRIPEIIETLLADGYQGALIAELYDYGDMFQGLKQSIVWMDHFLNRYGGTANGYKE